MMKFFTRQNKYNLAQTWTETYKARENNKLGLETIVEPQSSILEKVKNYSRERVVFTRADNGHSFTEAQKIQRLYAELGEIALVPVLA